MSYSYVLSFTYNNSKYVSICLSACLCRTDHGCTTYGPLRRACAWSRKQTCRSGGGGGGGGADARMPSTVTHKVAKTNKAAKTNKNKFIRSINLCSYPLPFFSSCAVDHSGTLFSLRPTLAQQYSPVVASRWGQILIKTLTQNIGVLDKRYISLSGWSAQELNFNKEFQEFETAFMFLVDSQCQGFHTNL